jgi:hypothetical protein
VCSSRHQIEDGREANEQNERTTYFSEIINLLSRPPTEFPDALPRVKRILEILPPAPPLPPRQQTEAELAKEVEKDVQAREMMIISFTGLVQDFMRKFRKVTATVRVCLFLPLLRYSLLVNNWFPAGETHRKVNNADG